MLILEGFQAGLSWECVLNKRENALFLQAVGIINSHEEGCFLWSGTSNWRLWPMAGNCNQGKTAGCRARAGKSN